MALSTKEAALKMIERMPDDASLEEIMYELFFRARVDRGLQELDEGKTVSHEEVKRSLAEWLRSSLKSRRWRGTCGRPSSAAR